MTRRSLLTGGIFTGLAGASAAGAAAASAPAPRAPSPQSSRAEEAKVLEQIRDELRLQRGSCSPASCGFADSIRIQQRTFLKSRGKFPDFIDVGIDVWDGMYDWFVMAGQKPEAGRMQDGRYGMTFMFTTLVLRHDMTGTYIGLGYDGRAE